MYIVQEQIRKVCVIKIGTLTKKEEKEEEGGTNLAEI